MELQWTARFRKDYTQLPPDVRKRLVHALEKFVNNSKHPSLHVKKMEGTPGIWELRVSDNYRITFQWIDDGALLRRVGTHDLLRRP